MSRKLNDISAKFRSTVFEFLARCTESDVPLMIIDTLRTPEEQAQNIANGVSWTTNSKHLPQPPDGKSLAIDVCPFETFQLNGADKLKWDSNDPVWEKLAQIGEACGMISGHRWKQRDSGHFEYKAAAVPAKRDDYAV